MITTAQVTTAVKELAKQGVTNARIGDVLAHLTPAGYTLKIQEPHHSLPRSWVVGGINADGTTWQRQEPVAPGQSAVIITRLLSAAWEHAESLGGGGRTVADARAFVAAHPLPVCPACGRTVLPWEAAVSSHPGYHRNCA